MYFYTFLFSVFFFVFCLSPIQNETGVEYDLQKDNIKMCKSIKI